MGYYIKKTGLSGKTVYWTGEFIGLMIVQRKKCILIKEQQTIKLLTPMVKMVVGQVQLSLVSS